MAEELKCKEIQEYGAKIISNIDEYCRKNELSYFMAGGTVLGAVRHKGFIPWDDDVDLMMPRPDYEKFIRDFKDDRYIVSSCEYDSDYNTPFARVWDSKTELRFLTSEDKTIGVFVDIFPIDGYPDNSYIAKLHMYRLKYRRFKINAANRKAFLPGEKYTFLKKLVKCLWRKSGNYYSRQLNLLAKKYSYDDCRYVGVTTTTVHIFKERNPKKLYEKTVYLDFEGMKLPAPIGYKRYLQKLYGDYMKLPPEDKRISEHSFTARLKED